MDRCLDQMEILPPEQYRSPAQAILFRLVNEHELCMMLLGAIVAECASAGLHAIYDFHSLSAKLSESTNAGVFFSPPSCPLYSYPTGSLSLYGEECLPLRESILLTGGIDREDVAARSADALRARASAGRTDWSVCMEKLCSAHDRGLAWHESAPKLDHGQSIGLVPYVVARYAGRPHLLSAVTLLVGVYQRSELVAASCRILAHILERCLLTKCSPLQALQHFASIVDDHTLRMSALERHLLNSAMSDTLLGRILDVGEILGMHAAIRGPNEDARTAAKIVASRVRGILAGELIKGGGAMGLIDSAPLTAKDKVFWSEAKQAARSEGRNDNISVEGLSFRQAFEIYGLDSNLPGMPRPPPYLHHS